VSRKPGYHVSSSLCSNRVFPDDSELHTWLIIITITRVSSALFVRDAASLHRCRIVHHQNDVPMLACILNCVCTVSQYCWPVVRVSNGRHWIVQISAVVLLDSHAN
jgi:hypothetical protein